jgi:hypothetical protein
LIDRGMAGRIITVAVCALVLALLVIRNAFVEAYGVQDPSRAAAVWPGHPSVVLSAGLTQVGESAAAGRPANPATVRQLEEAAAKAPLAPEPFLVRGVEAQLAGDAPLALSAFLAARERDPRSVAARFFLADHYLKAGQTQDGLAEISALTRLIPQSLGGIVPQLAAFARMPGGSEQVRLLLRQQPPLEPWLLNELAAKPSDANLALSLWNGRSTEQDRPWQQRLVNTLVSAGRIEEARAAWTRFDPQVRPAGELIDPKFELRAMPPFGWALASGPAGVAEPEGGGPLHILYYGRDDIVLASQLLLLKPGAYRLAMRVTGAQPAAKSLSWVIRCTQTARAIASIYFTSTKDGTLAMDFTIPPQGCAAQTLELAGTAPELPEQADLTISNLQLSRQGS